VIGRRGVGLSVNGESRQVGPGTTVAGLVEGLGRPSKGMAVAVNEEVVPRSAWPTVELRDGDRVEILVAVQGG
jgi:sulfur carrier protein